MKHRLNLYFQNSMNQIKNIDFKSKFQKIGQFMAGSIMPSIGILIAWGLWTALFLYDEQAKKPLGWINAPSLSKLIEPGITFLLPILIAYNAGKSIHKQRGGQIATFVILCAIIGTKYIYLTYYDDEKAPVQFLAAMLLAPLSAWLLKIIDNNLLPRIKPSFVMLVNNFSIGILAILLGLIVFFVWGFVIYQITYVIIIIVESFGSNKWMSPLLGLFTEPIKIMFLNNALNHGILGEIGRNEIAQWKQFNKIDPYPRSIFFLYDPNPGPGLGLLLSLAIFSKGSIRTSALATIPIHFLGGIHEVYFVFILATPKLLLSTTAGVIGAQFIVAYLGGGVIMTPSPGSIISLIALSPPNIKIILINLLSVLVGFLISFSISLFLVKYTKISIGNNQTQNILFDKLNSNPLIKKNKVSKIMVACEAGQGSSAMAAGILKNEFKKRNINIKVDFCAIQNLPIDVDLVVTMENFKKLVEAKLPNAIIWPVKQFIGIDIYKSLINYVIKINKKEKNNDK